MRLPGRTLHCVRLEVDRQKRDAGVASGGNLPDILSTDGKSVFHAAALGSTWNWSGRKTMCLTSGARWDCWMTAGGIAPTGRSEPR